MTEPSAQLSATVERVLTRERLGENLRRAIKAAGLTQQEVAERTELDPTALSRMLAGKRNVSSLELALICTATGSDVLMILEAEPLHGPSYRAGIAEAERRVGIVRPDYDGDYTGCGSLMRRARGLGSDAYCDLPHGHGEGERRRIHHAHLYWTDEDASKVAEALAAQGEKNPHLPEKPANGQHIFGSDGRSYRCSRCGVYNRPDAPSAKEVLDADCQGAWAQSGKMRAWAADEWEKDKALAAQPAADGLAARVRELADDLDAEAGRSLLGGILRVVASRLRALLLPGGTDA